MGPMSAHPSAECAETGQLNDLIVHTIRVLPRYYLLWAHRITGKMEAKGYLGDFTADPRNPIATPPILHRPFEVACR
jgi:hypothetical protein|eukprot:m.238920 g.238920  ORF g.238920 m.238920 type:complete len:77 (-) comp26243_c0_seq8:1043-1273(-)